MERSEKITESFAGAPEVVREPYPEEIRAKINEVIVEINLMKEKLQHLTTLFIELKEKK